MKNFLTVLFAVLFFIPSGWGGKLPKVPRVPSLSKAAVPKINVRKVFGGLPEPVLKNYGGLLERKYLMARIPVKLYPKLSLYNDRLTVRSLRRFEEQSALFDLHQAEIASKIKSVVTDKVSYAYFLPKKTDVLYIGEIHQEALVQAEIVNLVKSLRAVYPGRTIYLAAESVPSLSGETFSKQDIITTREQLQERLRAEAELLGLEEAEVLASAQVVEAALAEGIGVIGLENEEELLEFAWPENNAELTDEMYEDVVTSAAGMEWRNKQFASRIRTLRAYDPEALVVFYGGIDHAAYHNLAALPELVGGASFVVQVTVPSALWGTHPLYRNFRESEYLRGKFHSSPDAKLVETWKEPTEFNKLLGSDLTVIVHE